MVLFQQGVTLYFLRIHSRNYMIPLDGTYNLLSWQTITCVLGMSAYDQCDIHDSYSQRRYLPQYYKHATTYICTHTRACANTHKKDKRLSRPMLPNVTVIATSPTFCAVPCISPAPPERRMERGRRERRGSRPGSPTAVPPTGRQTILEGGREGGRE